jgi:tRNA(Ile)-lysidine synthase
MAASATPKPTLADFPEFAPAPEAPLAVALSGGADSTALLIASALRWPHQVHAIHVHHGLQAAADGFAAHCAQLCAAWQVPLTVRHVDARHAPGESPEDAARRHRYQALADAAREINPAHPVSVLLAQQADDQVETLLLALSRGAGLPGLASMPERFERHGVHFVRPWLHASGEAIRSTLERLGQAWAEDPTNQDLRYTRNRIRAEILPALARAFPAWRQTFPRSAAHAAQAQRLLAEIAAQDRAAVGTPPRIRALQALSAERQANVLRDWLREEGLTPQTAQLQELLRQIQACQTRGHDLSLKVGAGRVARDGEVLRCYNR